MFGLKDSDILSIKNVLARYPEVKKAYIFGSRAKGNFKNGSDVDIAIIGEEIDFSHILQISAFLNENTEMPYIFDVLDYDSITNKDLVAHIDRVGILFYEENTVERLIKN